MTKRVFAIALQEKLGGFFAKAEKRVKGHAQNVVSDIVYQTTSPIVTLIAAIAGARTGADLGKYIAELKKKDPRLGKILGGIIGAGVGGFAGSTGSKLLRDYTKGNN